MSWRPSFWLKYTHCVKLWENGLTICLQNDSLKARVLALWKLTDACLNEIYQACKATSRKEVFESCQFQGQIYIFDRWGERER